ncbi:MAG: lipoprotein-releasing ABC transporter permease subunit [Steroidobacteraceae bacterium]
MTRPQLPLPVWIGRRYLRLRSGERFTGVVSLIATAGIAVGVAVLITVLSVMNGFEQEVRERILDVTAHATLEALDGRLVDWPALAESTGTDQRVLASTPFVEGRAMLVRGEAARAAELRGVLPGSESGVSSLAGLFVEGSLQALEPGRFRVLLGVELASQLGVGLGDRVLLVVPDGVVTPAGVVPRLRRFEVAGTFDAGMYEFDSTLALVHLEDAQRFLRMGDTVTGLRFLFSEPFAAGETVRALALNEGGGFYITDWTRRQANFFRSIQVTRSIMLVVLLLVVAVAAFNIVATLVMVVHDKQGESAILRTLGAGPGAILSVFFAQGTVIGLLGTLLGVAGGLLLSLNLTALVGALEALLDTRLVDETIYFIDRLPVDVRFADVGLVSLIAVALGMLSTLYPAWRAARTEPAEVLRHDV